MLLGLVLVLFYFLERATFNKVAVAAFLAVQKEMGGDEGQAKMSEDR